MKAQYILLLFVLCFAACKKNESTTEQTVQQTKEGHLNIAAVRNGTQKEIVSLNLTSMNKTITQQIGAYYFGSTIFNPFSKSLGYSGEDSSFHFINLLSGEVSSEIKLPFDALTQTAIDEDDSCLIGLASNPDSMFIVRINMNTGAILSQHKFIPKGTGVNACGYFYDDEENKYYILREDNVLLTVNPKDGAILNTIELPAGTNDINNITYNPRLDQITGFNYNSHNDSNYVVTINLKNGNIVHNTTIKERNDYYGCISEFDSESNCYVLVTANNEILFIDITSGNIQKKFPLGFEISEFKFWRN